MDGEKGTHSGAIFRSLHRLVRWGKGGRKGDPAPFKGRQYPFAEDVQHEGSVVLGHKNNTVLVRALGNVGCGGRRKRKSSALVPLPAMPPRRSRGSAAQRNGSRGNEA